MFGGNDYLPTVSPINEGDNYCGDCWPKRHLSHGLDDFQRASGRHRNARPDLSHLVLESMLIEQFKERAEAAFEKMDGQCFHGDPDSKFSAREKLN